MSEFHAKNLQQLSLMDTNEEYKAFVDKFKPKLTTDDCLTPEPVYEAVAGYVEARYGIDRKRFVRPFYPGGDYERYDYPKDCCVVDNPPFSIISKIGRDYMNWGVPFFLFSPYLTNFSASLAGVTHIVTSSDIIYENGAAVPTSFLTNMEPGIEARSDGELHRLIKAANKERNKKEKPKYSYPPEVLTASMLGSLSEKGIDFAVMSRDAFFVRSLDSMKAVGKGLFGAGYLISEKAAAEKAAAEKAVAEKAAAHRWELSEREMEIIRNLG